jgi:hypothetical protein
MSIQYNVLKIFDFHKISVILLVLELIQVTLTCYNYNEYILYKKTRFSALLRMTYLGIDNPRTYIVLFLCFIQIEKGEGYINIGRDLEAYLHPFNLHSWRQLYYSLL